MVVGMARAESARQLEITQQCLGLIPSSSFLKAKDAVLICFDCEAYEDDHSKTTEIGVAVLDGRYVHSKQPEDLVAAIQASHFRIIEHRDLVNGKYVKANHDRFGFGSTTWISKNDVSKVLERIIRCPTAMKDAADFSREPTVEDRPVVIVGHGLSNEHQYLQQLGFSWTRLENVVYELNTQTVAGRSKKQLIGLSRLLAHTNIEPYNLHNAGNDAVYSLQALVTMATMEHDRTGAVATSFRHSPRKVPKTSRDNGVRAEHIYGGTATADSRIVGREDCSPPVSSKRLITEGDGGIEKFFRRRKSD